MAKYIEREAAYQTLTEYYHHTTEGMHSALREAISRVPAADVRPVKRGRWIEHYEPYSTGEEWIEAQYGYECSICGRWEYEKEPFCNCGADMREEN